MPGQSTENVGVDAVQGARSILSALTSVSNEILCREAPYFLTVIRTRGILELTQDSNELKHWCKRLRELLHSKNEAQNALASSDFPDVSVIWWTATQLLAQVIDSASHSLLASRASDWTQSLFQILKRPTAGPHRDAALDSLLILLQRVSTHADIRRDIAKQISSALFAWAFASISDSCSHSMVMKVFQAFQSCYTILGIALKTHCSRIHTCCSSFASSSDDELRHSAAKTLALAITFSGNSSSYVTELVAELKHLASYNIVSVITGETVSNEAEKNSSKKNLHIAFVCRKWSFLCRCLHSITEVVNSHVNVSLPCGEIIEILSTIALLRVSSLASLASLSGRSISIMHIYTSLPYLQIELLRLIGAMCSRYGKCLIPYTNHIAQILLRACNNEETRTHALQCSSVCVEVIGVALNDSFIHPILSLLLTMLSTSFDAVHLLRHCINQCGYLWLTQQHDVINQKLIELLSSRYTHDSRFHYILLDCLRVSLMCRPSLPLQRYCVNIFTMSLHDSNPHIAFICSQALRVCELMATPVVPVNVCVEETTAVTMSSCTSSDTTIIMREDECMKPASMLHSDVSPHIVDDDDDDDDDVCEATKPLDESVDIDDGVRAPDTLTASYDEANTVMHEDDDDDDDDDDGNVCETANIEDDDDDDDDDETLRAAQQCNGNGGVCGEKRRRDESCLVLSDEKTVEITGEDFVPLVDAVPNLDDDTAPLWSF